MGKLRVSDHIKELQSFGKITSIYEKKFDGLISITEKKDGEFCTFIEDVKYTQYINDSHKMIFCREDVAQELTNQGKGVIVVESPKEMFFRLHNILAQKEEYVRPSFKTIIEEDTNISPLAYIAPNNVIIRKGVTIEEFVSIKEDTIIGEDTLIRTGSVIGASAFIVISSQRDDFVAEPKGGTIIGRNVEIQENVCVEKSYYPSRDTIIGDHGKIDSGCLIGHDTNIGEHFKMAGAATVAGMVSIGDNVWVGLGANVSNALSIGDKAKVNIGAVVTKNVSDHESVTGNFAIPHEDFINNLRNNRKK